MSIKSGPGKPRFNATIEERSLVKSLAGLGMTQEDIGSVIGIHQETLRREFRDELDRGVIDANAKVAQTLFRMATSGTIPSATFFWLKTRAHWREVTHVEHSGEVTLKNASDADLQREIAALRARTAVAFGAGDVEAEVPGQPNGLVH